MSVSQPINVGIVGLGWPGERHAEAIIASPLGTVYAACDLDAERLKSFADVFGPRRVFTRFDEMLTGPGISCSCHQLTELSPLPVLAEGTAGRKARAL